MILGIFSALAAVAQEGDAATTIYGLYYRKPPLIEANTNIWNLGLVKHPVLLAIVKPAVALGITVPLAFAAPAIGGGVVATMFAAIPSGILFSTGLWMTIHNLILIKK